MTIVQAAILGIVQGVSEFLPISSSGHLVIFQEFFQLPADSVMFEVFVHFATVLAVLLYFKKDLFRLTRQEIWALVIASIPAGVVGILFESQIVSAFSSVRLVAVLLLVTGGLNLVIDKKLKQGSENHEITSKNAFVIGLLQAVAILPGISRSGSTLAAGLVQNISREAAFRFSFLMMIPVIVGASMMQLYEIMNGSVQVFDPMVLLVGGSVAFATGLLSLKLLEYMMTSAKTKYFAMYCFLLSGLLLFLGV